MTPTQIGQAVILTIYFAVLIRSTFTFLYVQFYYLKKLRASVSDDINHGRDWRWRLEGIDDWHRIFGAYICIWRPIRYYLPKANITPGPRETSKDADAA